MSVEAHSDPVARPLRRLKRLVRVRQLWRATLARFSSSLTRRIIVLNLGGLFALLLGFLYLNQFRAGLIDARLQSLQIQGEIIAAAIASSATVETDSIAIDPEKLLQLAPGQSYGPSDEASPSLEFSINPDRIGPLLHRLVSPTRTRARVYDRDGYMLLDSRSLTSRSLIVPSDLPPVGGTPGFWETIWAHFRGLYGSSEQSSVIEAATSDGRALPEVARALSGAADSVVRLNNHGETVVSVAVPIQRFRAVRGALLLSTQGGDIDKIIASERWAIVRIFLVSASVMLLLSLFFAGTIAEPIRRLAEAAERVRRGGKARHEIPDFSDRSDEIGHLSGALRDMTGSLYLRIEAIESFAADVAHELKNPLTSLRSAVETLPIAKTENSRKRLLEVIEHDVRRLDRLISDISDASRLDAELARFDMTDVDLSAVLQAVVGEDAGAHAGLGRVGARVQAVGAQAEADEHGVVPEFLERAFEHLALDLKAHEKEEDGHQAIVDPQEQRLLQGKGARAEGDLGGEEGLVGIGPGRVGPGKRGARGDEQQEPGDARWAQGGEKAGERTVGRNGVSHLSAPVLGRKAALNP